MRPGPSPETIKRIEIIEGSAVPEALNVLYLGDKLSYRQLCSRWGIATRTLMLLLKHFKIPPRKGSAAIRAQWLHAPEERRKKTSDLMKELCRSMKSRGYHPRAGKTKERDQGTRNAAEKLKKNTSAIRPEVRLKNAKSHRLYIRRNATAHCTNNAPPTKAESLMLDHLYCRGFSPIHNHIVYTELGPKWINVFMPELNLGIGCEHTSRFPLDWERHRSISSLGIRHIFITNKRIQNDLFGGLDKYILCLQELRPHPSSHGQNTVIWGRINPSIFKNQPDEVTVERISVDRGHTLLLTTSPDDPVLSLYRLYGLPA